MVARWRTGKHLGPYKPTQVVKIQRGLMDHAYMPFRKLDGSTEDFGKIGASSHNHEPWQAFWRATGPWIDLPNVSQVNIEQGFDSNGVATATITVENILMKRVAAALGSYTAMKRGYLSPWLGFRAVGRPITTQQINEWYDVLNGGYRVKVWQGYGNVIEPEFTGLVDDTDIHVLPDTITITCRDFGQLLTDQRVFGSVKAKEIRSPVVFATSQQADDTSPVSAGPVASTTDPGYPVNAITRNDSDYWRSAPHDTDATEWVEIHLPRGRYETFYLDPQYAGMECWVSFYTKGNATVDGADHAEGWVGGGGEVPGANGGHLSIRHIPNIGSGGLERQIGVSIVCGDDSVLRISFRNLPPGGDGKRRAGVRRLIAYKRKRKAEVKTRKWVLVDDYTDIAKWVFMWAGFKEWEVEASGVKPAKPLVFHQGDFLVDILKHIQEQGNFVTFIRRPSAYDDSLGVPVLRRTRAIEPPTPGMVDIRDTTVLTGLETKFSKESLPYILRFRGAPADSGSGLGELTSKRFMASYLPPWSGTHSTGRLSGVIKHQVHTDSTLQSDDECKMACILTAIQAALAAYTGNVQIPGLPGIDLDDQVGVIDRASGTNQRMWLASKNSSFVTGEQGSFTTTLAGSMIDTPDLQAIGRDYLRLLAKVARR